MLVDTADLREKQSLENCRPTSRRPRNRKTLKTITKLVPILGYQQNCLFAMPFFKALFSLSPVPHASAEL